MQISAIVRTLLAASLVVAPVLGKKICPDTGVDQGPGQGPVDQGPGQGPVDQGPGQGPGQGPSGPKYFGCATDYPEKYGTLVQDNFNMIVAENAFKWVSVKPTVDSPYNFTGAEHVVKFANEHDMMMRGHTLVWHAQVPEGVCSKYAEGDFNCAESEIPEPKLREMYKERIKLALKTLKDPRIMGWDVVNEAFTDDDEAESDIKDMFLKQVLGEDYVEWAFIEANKWAVPTTELYYNDYNIDAYNKKSTRVYNRMKLWLETRPDIRIDGVGFQMHLTLKKGADIELAGMRKNFQRFADLGLKIHITEMDITVEGYEGTDEEKWELQADWYGFVADLCQSIDQCEAFVVWGVQDQDSWRKEGFPLLFDNEGKQKPAYYAVKDGLDGKLEGSLPDYPPIWKLEDF